MMSSSPRCDCDWFTRETDDQRRDLNARHHRSFLFIPPPVYPSSCPSQPTFNLSPSFSSPGTCFTCYDNKVLLL